MFLPLVAVLATLTAGPTGSEPTYDQLLAEVRRTGKPIFLDVGASWCPPCKDLEQRVFPHPDVKAAMAPYRFQRYDGEKGAGIDVARRFAIDTYPTLIALTPDGFIVERAWSREPVQFAAELEKTYPVARTRGPVTEAELAKRPNDAGLLYLAALDAFRSGKHPEKGAVLLARAEAADKGNKKGIAQVAAELLIYARGPRMARKNQAELFDAYVRKYPRAPFAQACIEGLASMPYGYRGHLAPLGDAAVAAAQGATERAHPELLERLAMALLVLGETKAAVIAAGTATALEPDNLRIQETFAQAQYRAGAHQEAFRILEAAQRVSPDPTRAALLERLRAGQPGTLLGRFNNPLE